MRRKTFIYFGLLVLVLAVVIPFVAFRGSGDADTGDQKVAANLKHGQELFQTNCGTCHTLYAAGTDGNYGPNLDELLAANQFSESAVKGVESRVVNAVEAGIDGPTPGRMPAGILGPQQVKEVAKFVGNSAGKG